MGEKDDRLDLVTGAGSQNGPGSIAVAVYKVPLAITRSGCLLPWIGPALRGIVAAELKQSVCHHPPQQQKTRWRYCDGCEFQATCPYGVLFEPPPGQARHVMDQSAGGSLPVLSPPLSPDDAGPPTGSTGRKSSGGDEASRPVVISCPFPLPQRLARGQLLTLQVLLIGRNAVEPWPQLLEAIEAAGRTRGIGPQRVKFDVGRQQRMLDGLLRAEDFPVASTDQGVLPELTVELTAPLFLRRRDAYNRRITIFEPQLSDLVRSAARTLVALFRQNGVAFDAHTDQLLTLAKRSTIRAADLERFEQSKWSNRTRNRFTVRGITGRITYANVPWSLIAWLYWGGKLGVGLHRVAGAGLWQLSLHQLRSGLSDLKTPT